VPPPSLKDIPVSAAFPVCPESESWIITCGSCVPLIVIWPVLAVPVETIFWDPKSGLIFVPAIAAELFTLAFVTAWSAISAPEIVPLAAAVILPWASTVMSAVV